MTEEKSNAATLPPQFGLRTVFIAMAVVALALASILAIQRAMYRSPHQRAIDSVNGLDGWAREEDDGYVVADLNGGTCPIRDESLRKLVDCQRLRKLTAYQTQLTDAGLHYLRVHKDLRILHLDDCPLETDDTKVGEAIGKIVARASVVLYGVLFTLFCIAGTIDDLISREPILETLFWLAMSVLTCYGIFALAIRRFRILQLNRFWWYFGAALPLLTYLGAGWEIYHQPTMPPIEFAAVFAMFVLITTPGLICNWMLRSRLSSPAKDGG